MLQEVNDYLLENFKTVQGWCSPHLWQAIQPLHEDQKSLGIDLPVAEIGVYHGKFLIGLVKTKNISSANFAIDVFDMQQFNLDGAGKGNLDTLLHNFNLCNVALETVEILRADSMALGDSDVERILAKSQGFSFFSVDGCHLPDHTVNDVKLAMRMTVPEGIILVDDYYNANWPGVQEGISKMYFSEYPRFVPLLFTCNKLFLCHLSFHSRYLRAVTKFIEKNFPETKIKKVKRFGFDSLTVLPNIQSTRYVA